MAVYTIELDTLIKSGYDIGLTDYPLPSYLTTEDEKERFRDALNKKIIAHYRFNEICCIPPDRFKHFLNTTMNEIMPVKNLLYDALAENWKFYTGGKLQEDIEHADDNKRELAKSGVDTVGNITNNSSSNSGYVLNVSSDTPGAMLNIETDIANNTYANNANKNKSNGTTTGNSTSTDTTTYNSKDTDTYTGTGKRHRTVTGLNGKSYAELFKEYQDSLRNIDMEVIQAIGSCFMSVF